MSFKAKASSDISINSVTFESFLDAYGQSTRLENYYLDNCGIASHAVLDEELSDAQEDTASFDLD